MNISWHKYPKFIDELVGQAGVLLQQYPNADVISIGQSPAWLCKVACIMGRQKKIPTRFTLMPFSKYFCDDPEARYEEPETPDAPKKLIKTFNVARPHHVHLYRKRLQKLDLCPDQIIARYKKNGRPTVFLDYARSGKGLASFTHMMMDWAYEKGGDKKLQELAAAIRIHVLFEKGFRGFERMEFSRPAVGFDLNKQIVSAEFVLHFSDARNDSPDRLVAFYPCKDWDMEPVINKEKPLLVEIGSVIAEAGMRAAVGNPALRGQPRAAATKG